MELLTQDAAAGRSLLSCAAGVLHSPVLCVCAARSSSTPLLEHISFPQPAGSEEGQEQQLQHQGLTAVTPPAPRGVSAPSSWHRPGGSTISPAPAAPLLPSPSQPGWQNHSLISPTPLSENYQVGSPCSRRCLCLRGEESAWDLAQMHWDYSKAITLF